MYPRTFDPKDTVRPHFVLDHCGSCDFNDGTCNGWKCAAVLAERLSYYEYTCLVIPAIRSEKWEILPLWKVCTRRISGRWYSTACS